MLIVIADGIAIFIILSPLIIARISTIPIAFRQEGSFGVRLKIWREAMNQFTQSPIFGIGVNRFQYEASQNPVTDIFRTTGFTPATKIHNIFIEYSFRNDLIIPL